MPVDRSDVERALTKKGFALEEGDHRFYTLWVDGKRTHLVTKVSKGSSYKSLGDELVAKMARQLRLSKGEFMDLVRCPLTHQALVDKLRARKEL